MTRGCPVRWPRSMARWARPPRRWSASPTWQARCVIFSNDTRRPLRPWVSPAVSRGRSGAFLHEHHAEAVSLDRCAAVAALSRFHLLRAFAAETGLPPHTYQLGLRIARARGLLAAGLPPALVAIELGFADQSHFTRCFRQTVGVTPRVYAQAVR
jgi:AraC-like DNA-binding protein